MAARFHHHSACRGVLTVTFATPLLSRHGPQGIPACAPAMHAPISSSVLEERTMRYLGLIATLLMISGCSSGSSHSATLTLDNPTWDRVNVQAVITRSSDCDDRQNGYVATDNFIMTKGHSHDVVAPNAETICWRHDRDPNNPVAGDWSGWSRATLFPGQTTESDL
jgi:hypothetical protein